MTRRGSLAAFTTIVVGLALGVRADDAPRDELRRWRDDEVYVVPLHVHVMKSDELPEANCTLTDEDVRRIVGKVNGVWGQAGIRFELVKIDRVAPANVQAFREEREKEGARELRPYRWLLGEPTEEGVHVYYVHDLPVNGVYLGRNRAIVKETAKLREVEGGIDEPLPRVTAHEIGHALGLLHRQARTNLMASGTTGTSLSETEIARARGNAGNMRGAKRLADMKGN